MKNVYDIRYEKNLTFILPEKSYVSQKVTSEVYKKTAVIMYLYYIDTLATYYRYIENIPECIDTYIISSRKEVLEEVKKHIEMLHKREPGYILKENRGRDISALLVTGREIVSKYEYVCFLHDKKEHYERLKSDNLLWIENLWGNQIGSPDYINGILELFQNNAALGVIAPPEPIGQHFNTWYGFGWYKSFEITKYIAEKLQLNADIRPDKPPVTFGTALWFRSRALKRLFDAGWRYTDFHDGDLSNDHYLSYAIERIFAYVAQDAGYDTGTSMTISYAEKQTAYLQYTTNMIMQEAQRYFPVNNVETLHIFKKNRKRILEFARNNEKIFLYGAGTMGRFCLSVLRSEDFSPVAYIVSEDSGFSVRDGISVLLADEMDWSQDMAVIITVYDPEFQKKIADKLEHMKCSKYIKFWE